MSVFPKRIAVTVSPDGDGPAAENLLAWATVSKADDGRVAVYELVDELEKKDIPHLKRKGTKTWFKAST